MPDVVISPAQNVYWLERGTVVDNVFGAVLSEPFTVEHDGLYLALPNAQLIDLGDAKYPVICATRTNNDGTLKESAYYDATGKRIYPSVTPA